MKKNIIRKGAAVLAVGLTLGMTYSCNDYIEVDPQGILDKDLAYSDPEALVTTAYAALGDDWYSYPFNLWPYGDICSDDALKGGSGENDTGYHPMEIFKTLTNDRGEFDELWYRLYVAISRCNRALDALDQNGATVYKDDLSLCKQRIAEAKFLRAHFYYKLVTMWYQVPWIDLQVFRDGTIEQTSNTQYTHEEQMKLIIADFEEAYNNLPSGEISEDGYGITGRANKEAAASYLAQCYLDLAYGDGYEANTGYSHINQEYMKKVLEYTQEVMNSSYDLLDDYGDVFLPDYANSKESIFAVQHSNKADDGTTYGRANWSNMLNGVWKMWTCGWDFHKPSQNFVNAFKTKNGLPMFNDYDKDHNVILQRGTDNGYKYDPRLFHTVGMPTYPYKYEDGDYKLTTENSRTPNTYGYYCSMKEVPQRSKGEDYDNPWQAFPMNDYVFRFADVALMRAEALIETGQWTDGMTIINKIRKRAADSVSKHISYAEGQCDIAQYTKENCEWTQEFARKALRWERRLELGMEHRRFFDLRRWGMLSKTLNAYFQSEVNDEYNDGTVDQTYALYYKDAYFTAGKNEYFPISSNQMTYVPGLYKQNTGY